MISETAKETNMTDNHTHSTLNHTEPQKSKPTSALQSSLIKPSQNPEAGKSSLHSAFQNSSNQNVPAKKSADETVLIKYSAHWVNKKEDDKLYTVPVELPHYETVGDAINDVLPLLNKCMLEANSPYILSEDPSHFDLYKAKKNGHPKLDYPALDANQMLNQTGVQMISIVEKDPKSIGLRSAPEKPQEKVQEKPKTKVNEKPKESMVNTSMPEVMDISLASHSDLDDYEYETTCFCIKKKIIKKKKVPQSISMQQNLSTGLLDTQ